MYVVDGDRREEGTGSVWEVGSGNGENRGKLCNIAHIFQSKWCKEAGENKNRAGTGIKGYEKWEVLNSPVPPRYLVACMFFSFREGNSHIRMTGVM